MKTFNEIRNSNNDDLSENRLLRKGIATAYAVRARNEGKKIEMELNSAKNALKPRSGDTTEEQIRRLQEGLIKMCDANIALRHQLGSITALGLINIVMTEKNKKN